MTRNRAAGPPPIHWIDEGSGLPIVWIHGFPLSGRIWSGQITMPGFRHIVPDLAGFGKSTPDDTISIDAYASSIVALLDHLNINRALVAGLSMGGYITLALLRTVPERFSGVILVDTKETPDTPEGRARRLEAIDNVSSNGITGLVDHMLPDLLFKASPRLIQQAREIMEESSPRGTVNALRAMADRTDSSAVLRNLEAPALVIVGAQDTLTPPSDAERMAAMIPSCCLVKIDGAGHLSNLQQPEIFNTQVEAFARREGLRR